MRKSKALNGLPNDLVQLYFSTEAYFRNGYMADHLRAIALRTGLREAMIDILNGTIAPIEFGTTALLSYLPTLRQQVLSTLDHLELPSDHVTEAQIHFVMAKLEAEVSFVTGTGCIVTSDGRLRKGHTYSGDGTVIT
ncbi:MAG: hypothetical protein ACOH13_01920 [Flavobacteriales bacterium]